MQKDRILREIYRQIDEQWETINEQFEQDVDCYSFSVDFNIDKNRINESKKLLFFETSITDEHTYRLTEIEKYAKKLNFKNIEIETRLYFDRPTLKHRLEIICMVDEKDFRETQILKIREKISKKIKELVQ